MKAYILTESDFEKLFLMIDRNPEYGTKGGSSQSLTHDEEVAYQNAHRFYNYQVRTWAEEMKR